MDKNIYHLIDWIISAKVRLLELHMGEMDVRKASDLDKMQKNSGEGGVQPGIAG